MAIFSGIGVQRPQKQGYERVKSVSSNVGVHCSHEHPYDIAQFYIAKRWSAPPAHMRCIPKHSDKNDNDNDNDDGNTI